MTVTPKPANAGQVDPANAGSPQTPDTQNDPAHSDAGTPPAADPAANAAAALNARLLQESREHKARAQRAEQALAAKLEAEKAEQGQFKTLYEAEQQKNQQLNSRIQNEKKNSAVRAAAQAAGCTAIDAVLKLGDLSGVILDDETLEVSGAEGVVEAVKRAYPQLFANPKAPVINTTTPGQKAPPMPAVLNADNFSRMTPEQKKVAWKQLNDSLHDL